MPQEHDRPLQPPSDGTTQHNADVFPRDGLSQAPSQGQYEGYDPRPKVSSSPTDPWFGLYLKIVTHPSVATFASELPNASWTKTWFLLSSFTVIRVALFISTMQMQVRLPHSTILWGSFLALFFVPMFFFLGMAVQYQFARWWGGEGSFLGQCYTNLLFTFPLGIATGIISTLLAVFLGTSQSGLVVSNLLTGALGMYTLALTTIQIQASHRLHWIKATAVVLASAIILLASAVLLVVLILTIYVPVGVQNQ
jgi:hypothetical protein